MHYYRHNPDEELRNLERRFQADPTDPQARALYRNALIRVGRGNEAGLAIGDIVRVQEATYEDTHPAIVGPWIGVINGILPENRQEFIEDTTHVFERHLLSEVRVRVTHFINQSRWNEDQWLDLTNVQTKGVPCWLRRDQVSLVTAI